MDKKLFYNDKPLFGLDIGFKSVKVMQLEHSNSKYTVSGYGFIDFDETAVQNGVITDFESMAKSIHELFTTNLTGEISTRRVAVSVPASRTFSRVLSLPLLAKKDVNDAVRMEAEQYIPLPIEDLYIDHSILKKTDEKIDVLAVAVPKKIVDSYVRLMHILDLEPAVLETTTSAIDRLFRYTAHHDIPTVLIDFGSVSTDISIYDKYLSVTGTVQGGGDDITLAIAKSLGVKREEAHIIKLKYGLNLSKKQNEITKAVSPLLQKTIKEIKRMIRYYEERTEKHGKIEQIVTFGGGANMPGLSEYLIDHIRVPVRASDPWNNIVFKHLQPPTPIERSMFVIAASLALIKNKEAFS